ncbi:protein of unknown function DUF1080 [Chthoniobacter flavus Ellin428]|uniref:3-keto-alpha-glucoside-1,2-lyase/3-keto-2-hydroxy-glucal hydratase domain-containing protein n=1 Tax=Chthoniobacter flavus Ellin428 TaxID=497964 RepID=B4CV81_9BACT|nr:DUF1080 domain-containing protein [Chthoniobacter flavus]EDY22469.1 protein of unknown function DUF1080 [Chthoniobacter flavus Ellin428]TCO82127.1 uncharacterized protein DUF1080 [Chthoniobacter flavus]
MIKSRFLPLVASLSILTVAAFAEDHNTLSAKEKADGWKLLFDGKDTDGWVAIGKTAFPEKGWSVQDGVLVHAEAGGGGDVVTKDRFENFELTFDWIIGAGANSGVKYNLPNPDKNVGFEYQLLDDEHHPDGIKGGRLHQTGSLYDLIEPPADKKINPVGEWNSSRIVVKGNHCEEWLNGVKTVEFELGSDDMKARIAKSKFAKVAHFGEKVSSPILLQDHGGLVKFRDIKIRTLDAK